VTAGAITTRRLRLVPHAAEHLRALIEGPEQYARSAGLKPATGLRDFIVSPDVSADWLAALQTASGADPWKYGFAVVDRETETAIGNAGFTGPPDATGAVEIAYGIVPDYQGRGCATEAAEALVRYAQADPRARTIRAHTLPARNASTRVLEKCGFTWMGQLIHETDGRIWRWEKALEPA
jgi:[ribosomal protein S5]-alanine N-acetyltransferase